MRVVHEHVRSPGGQPLFSLLHEFLVEGQVDHFLVFLILVLKLDLVSVDVAEVVLSLL